MAKIEKDKQVQRVLEEHARLQAQVTLGMLGETQPLADALDDLADKVKKKVKRQKRPLCLARGLGSISPPVLRSVTPAPEG